MIRGRARTRELFPVSLYASLLLAMVCLVRPEPARVVQRACSSVAALPLRAWHVLAPRPVDASGRGIDAEQLQALSSALDARLRQAALDRPVGVSADLVPVPLTVVDRRDRGAAGAASVLVVAASREGLSAAAPYVTFGDALVGFLATDPVPDVDARTGRPDPFAGFARVELVHRSPRGGLPRRVPAEIVAPGRGALRFLVEPATDLDRWPLRCDLLDDPYLAASLGDSGLSVTTTGFVDDPLGELPVGLEIGSLRLFGYRVDGGRRVVPIGLFVEPRWPAASLHHVVVWAPRGALASGATENPVVAVPLGVRLTRLPVPGVEGERLFATSAARSVRPISEAAAVVAQGRLVGVVDAGGWGFGVVAPFGVPGRRWPVTLLPDESERAPLDLVTVARGRDGGRVELEVAEGASPAPAAGHLFTAAAGPLVPAGVWIGRAQLDALGRVRVDHVPQEELAGAAEVCELGVTGGGR